MARRGGSSSPPGGGSGPPPQPSSVLRGRPFDLRAREPPHVGELALLRVRRAGRPAGAEAEHQRGRERPRLGGDVLRLRDLDAALLHHLPGDGLLERLARLHEARQGGVAPRRPHGLAAEQQAVAVRDDHDHDRVGAGMVLRAAARAHAHEPGLPHLRQRAAGRAEAVPAVPVEERGGVGHDPALLLGEDHDGVAEPDRARPVGGLRRARGRAAGGAGRQRRRRLGARAAARPRRRRRAARARRGRAAAARRPRAPRRAGRSRAGRPPGARRRCPPRPRAPRDRRAAPPPRRRRAGARPRRGRGARRRTRSRQGRDDLGGEQLERLGVAVQEVLEHHALDAGVRVLGEPLGDLRRAAGRPAVVGREAGRTPGARRGRAPRRRPPRPRSRA